jgi:hypothetical protein
METWMIKAGDLVMVTRPRPCGCPSPRMGIPFIAKSITKMHMLCATCGHEYGEVWRVERDGVRGTALFRLTKIDPPPIREQITEEAVA